MESVFDAILKNGNGISVVSVLMIGVIAFIWAIESERLFTGGRGREMKKTIETQATALEAARTALRETERDLDRLTILYELRIGNGERDNIQWPTRNRNPA